MNIAKPSDTNRQVRLEHRNIELTSPRLGFEGKPFPEMFEMQYTAVLVQR